MARQDINDALLSTSFLYGGNAAYIEDLYNRYKTDVDVNPLLQQLIANRRNQINGKTLNAA